MNNRQFKLPVSFLNQLSEFSKGFILITINEQGEFECFQQFDNSVSELGMANFLEMHAASWQESLRTPPITIENVDEDEDTDEEDN